MEVMTSTEKLSDYYKKFFDAAGITGEQVVCIRDKNVGGMLLRARKMFADENLNHIENIICQLPGRERQTAIFRNMVYDYFVTKEMFTSMVEKYLPKWLYLFTYSAIGSPIVCFPTHKKHNRKLKSDL